MKKIYLMLLIGLYGCSPSIRAYYDYDKGDHIQNYRTFNWEIEKTKVPNSSTLYNSQLTDIRIISAVNDLLRVKGYKLTEGDADLSLRYYIEMEERSIFWPDPDGYMYGDYFMRPRPNTFIYREGTLSIDFINARSKNLVWHGWAVGAMEVVNYDTTNTNAVIRSTVTKILLNLPEATIDTIPAVTFR